MWLQAPHLWKNMGAENTPHPYQLWPYYIFCFAQRIMQRKKLLNLNHSLFCFVLLVVSFSKNILNQNCSYQNNFDQVDYDVNYHNYFNLHICSCPSTLRRHYCPVTLSSYQILQSYQKMSLIKASWYVFRMIYIHSWSFWDDGIITLNTR